MVGSRVVGSTGTPGGADPKAPGRRSPPCSGYHAGVPSGRAHETINLVVLGVVAAGYAYGRARGYAPELDAALPAPARTAFLASYLVGTFLVTPDLDLAENRVRAKSNWGLLGLLWVPYGHLFKHRGLSHSWLLGPATRLGYLALLALAFAGLTTVLGPYLGYGFNLETQVGSDWRELALGALTGYYLSQWLHLLADGVRPDHGLRRRRRGRGPGRSGRLQRRPRR